MAVAAALLFGCAYAVLAITSRELLRNGQKIADASRQQLKALQEGLGAVRDVLLDGSHHLSADLPSSGSSPAQTPAKWFFRHFPRYALEALGWWLLLCSVDSLRGSGDVILPSRRTTLAACSSANVQRLVSLKGYNAAIHAVLAMLNQPLPPQVTVMTPTSARAFLEGVHSLRAGATCRA